MTNSTILDSLNDAQRAAVAAPSEHLLILAGAGSGKTRVLVHRIAWLVENENLGPDRILAVTFTNKAAAEMRGRIESMLNVPLQRLWVGTFHGMAHRLLRTHWQEAGLPQAFQVIDSDDQQRLIRRIMKNLNLDETRWPPKQAQWFINAKKEEGIRPQQILADDNFFTETYRRVYQNYEEICRAGGLVDFSELLLRSYEIWESHPELLHHYQQRFVHILVDEFQDTNQIQYLWLKKLAGQSGKLMMVGDDDQSIYSWRGAKVEHLRRFVQDYPSAQTIRLEQNYRSTGMILNAANAEMAILYRSNAQSRVIEEQLLQANIPYRVYGGLRFFERAEIKDALAYLRLIANRDDDSAFDRVVNTPTRGIGETTMVAVRECAKNHDITLWRAANLLISQQTLATRAATALQGFIQLIIDLGEATRDMQLHKQTEYVLENSSLLPHYRDDRSEKGLARVENLEELIAATSQFVPEFKDLDALPLTEFLSRVALESGEHQAEEFTDCVHLMTLHSAKGLEFPVVFLTGVEEGLFPHAMSSQNPLQLEEERRLCYVGMTRAMSKLYLTYAESRYIHGREMRQRPSRFIREIPEEFLSETYMKAKISRPVYFAPKVTQNANAQNNKLPLGRQVRHPNFGEGVILDYEGEGEHARVQVRFRTGMKWLVVSYAKLEML